MDRLVAATISAGASCVFTATPCGDRAYRASVGARHSLRTVRPQESHFQDPRYALGYQIGHHGDGPLHADPAIAVSMLETRGLLSKNTQLRGNEHRDLQERGASSLEHLFYNVMTAESLIGRLEIAKLLE